MAWAFRFFDPPAQVQSTPHRPEPFVDGGQPVSCGRQRKALPVPRRALVLAGTIPGQAIAPVQGVGALRVAGTVVWLGLRKR